VLAIHCRCLQMDVSSRCCFPSQDTKSAFISFTTTRLVCWEDRGHCSGRTNKRTANMLVYSILLLHSVHLQLSGVEESSGYVYMGIQSRGDISPTTQSILTGMVSTDWISHSLSMGDSLRSFLIPNIRRKFIS
jgi:hypothetical protein